MYKRQGKEFFQLGDGKIADSDGLCPSGGIDFFQMLPGVQVTAGNRPVDQIEIDVGAVSYTHLDVYKRQKQYLKKLSRILCLCMEIHLQLLLQLWLAFTLKFQLDM